MGNHLSEDLIEKLILETFRILKDLKDGKSEETNIVFPFYHHTGNGNSLRISEQEAKQIFIKLLERDGIAYSVETPTVNKYSFSKDKKPCIAKEKGKSASIDVSIYLDKDKKDKPYAHIEFKAKNCVWRSIHKDFLKLTCEKVEGDRNYFVHILESSDEETWSSVLEKYKGKGEEKADYQSEGISIRCYLISLCDEEQCRARSIDATINNGVLNFEDVKELKIPTSPLAIP